jgi:Family of unknown function (DUF5694)
MMKKKLIVLTLILYFTLSSLAQEGIKKALDSFPTLKKDTLTSIMILGTFHFNFDQNVSDVNGENNFHIYSEERQKELQILIKKIRKFKPTKIVVEIMLPNQLKMDSLFKAYSAGTWKLGKNEVYQVGFRLAKELGLNGVSCVDTRIFANIKRLVKSENERILVIYGNSHAWVLEELFATSPEFKIIKVDTKITAT